MRFLQTFLRSMILCLITLTTQVSSVPAGTQPEVVSAIDRFRHTSIEPTAPFSETSIASAGLATSNSITQSLYLPLTSRITGVPLFEISAWTENGAGSKTFAFLANQPIRYRVRIINNTNQMASITFRWIQRGPCDVVILFSENLTLGADPLERAYTDTTINCFGVYVNLIQVSYKGELFNTFFNYIVTPPSEIIIGGNQGFDRCDLPSLDTMETWWENSPYYTYNLYLGGISLGCSISRLNPSWVFSAARQGWTFILTWVGPQAPCTTFKYRMDPNQDKAYLEGRAEADLAAAAAERLGFMGKRVIYYDIESYSGASESCRNTVASFVRGWVERLHELGFNAGAYGAPCSSYISDWAEVNPPPDDVWIAHWYADGYDPDATVWDAPCLSNTLWVDHQRIKQYVGSHNETWGDVTLRIDSDVLDGEIVTLPGVAETQITSDSSPKVQLSTPRIYPGPQIQAMGLASANEGWTILSDKLLWTEDGGMTWKDITPSIGHDADGEKQTLLTADFFDAQHGAAVLERPQDGAVFVTLTEDGGQTWQMSPLQSSERASGTRIQAAHLDYADAQAVFTVLKLQSGSAFSLGKLFASEDTGRTWQERPLPAGEPVAFLDSQIGWTTSMTSSGRLLYRTTDGGLTWTLQSLPLPSGEVEAGLPVFFDDRRGWLPALVHRPNETNLVILGTANKGNNWKIIKTFKLPETTERGEGVLLDLVSPHRWGTIIGGTARLLTENGHIASLDLPSGVIALDFFNRKQGWALVQEGICKGKKVPLGSTDESENDPFTCQQFTHLLSTVDGGQSWVEITPPIDPFTQTAP